MILSYKNKAQRCFICKRHLAVKTENNTQNDQTVEYKLIISLISVSFIFIYLFHGLEQS